VKKVYLDTGRTTKKKEYESFEVEISFVQMYVDVNDVFHKLRYASSMHLIIWIVTNMDRYNQIYLNKSNRSDFLSSCRGKYKDSTVKSAIRELQNANLIINMSDSNKREAQYMVNPSYFWKTANQKDRIEAIRGYRYKIKENEAKEN